MDDAESEAPSVHSSENLSRLAGISTTRSEDISTGATIRRAKAAEKGLIVETPGDGDGLRMANRTIGLPTSPRRPVHSNSCETDTVV